MHEAASLCRARVRKFRAGGVFRDSDFSSSAQRRCGLQNDIAPKPIYLTYCLQPDTFPRPPTKGAPVP